QGAARRRADERGDAASYDDGERVRARRDLPAQADAHQHAFSGACRGLAARRSAAPSLFPETAPRSRSSKGRRGGMRPVLEPGADEEGIADALRALCRTSLGDRVDASDDFPFSFWQDLAGFGFFALAAEDGF